MACHADRREARSQQPPGEGSESNANRKSSPTREDGWPIGYGMATAVYDVPALERIHATLPAALWAGHVFQPEVLVVPKTPKVPESTPAAARSVFRALPEV